MPNTYVNKVQLADNTVLIDISSDTVMASTVLSGYTGHDASGAPFTGTYVPPSGAISVVDTSDSHGGTVRTITAVDISDTTAIASDVASGKYFYTADGTKTAGAASGGGGGLEYETGTWTPTEDVTEYIIPFANTHTVAPFYYMIADVTGTYDGTLNSCYRIMYYNWGQVFASPIYASSTLPQYGEVRAGIRTTSTSTIGAATANLTSPYTDPGAGGSTYPRYWATETGIKAYCYATTAYWRAGRTYKWIAVWPPTT